MVVKRLPGAVDVVADPIRGKPYIEVRVDRERAARLGVSIGEVNEVIETALAGKAVYHDRRGPRAAPGRRPLRPGLARGRRVRPRTTGDRARLGTRAASAQPRQVPLSEVAEVRVVEGPATIKSENGLLRNYVRRERRTTATLPTSWPRPARRWPKTPSFLKASSSSGRASSNTRLRAADIDASSCPIVVALIFLILYLTYHDMADAALDDAGSAGCDRRRPLLPVAAGHEALGDGLGRLHRLFRHGDLDRDHHAGLPP